MNKNENLVKWGEIRILRKKSPKIVIKEKNMDKSWEKIMPFRGGGMMELHFILQISFSEEKKEIILKTYACGIDQ